MTMDELDKKHEIEMREVDKIRKSGLKRIVSDEKYSEHFDPSRCAYCMNYNPENETCNKSMPNIDPWYTKDNSLTDDCEEWDYVFTTIDGD